MTIIGSLYVCSEHKDFLKESNPRKANDEKWIQDTHNRRFIDWFRHRVSGNYEVKCMNLYVCTTLSFNSILLFQVADQLNINDTEVTETVKWLAHGPRKRVFKYSGYAVDGYRYHTKTRDDERVVQNSAVCVVASTMQVSSAKDKNPIVSKMKFYGVIEEIWELNYHQFRVPLFKCAWVENEKGIKNHNGLTLVNLNRRGHRNDEFVMASQVSQVFYVDDPENIGWSIALPMPSKVYTYGDEIEDVVFEHQSFTKGLPPVDEFKYELAEGASKYLRTDCDGIWVTNPKKKT